MTWELVVGVGVSGPLAIAPDPTIAALAATVASAAATGSVACQTTEAPAMMVWDSGPEAAYAAAGDAPESGPWRSVDSDDWDEVGTDAEMSEHMGATRDLVGQGDMKGNFSWATCGISRFSPNRCHGIGKPPRTVRGRSARASNFRARCTRARAFASLIPISSATSAYERSSISRRTKAIR